MSPSALAGWAQRVDQAYLAQTSALYARQPLSPAQRAVVGSRALHATLPDESTWLPTFFAASGMGGFTAWPARRLDVVAVDAVTGDATIFDGSQNVALNVAVAASACVAAFSPPITIGGRSYVDGGVAGTNLAYASGSGLVLAVVPHPETVVSSDVDALRAAGARVVMIAPDAASLEAIGPNTLDASRKPASADVGLQQGTIAAAALGNGWSG